MTELPFLGEGDRNYQLWLELNRLGIGITSWVTPPLLAGWAASTRSVQYRKVNGIVFLKGQLTTLGTTGATIFTLPVGFCPKDDCRFAASTGSATYPAALVVTKAGAVQLFYSAGTTISLEDVSFPLPLE